MFLILLLMSCTQTDKEISDYITPFKIDEINEGKAFEHIGNIVANKEIVILGESDHGDGRSIELKARLVKYLIEEKGFNTFAGEGAGFLDMESLNKNSSGFKIPFKFLNSIWTQSWGDFKPTQNLVTILEENQLKYIGLESYSYLLSQSTETTMDYLKENLTAVNRVKFTEQLSNIEKTLISTSYFQNDTISENELNHYIENLEIIITNLKKEDYTQEFKSDLLIMVIENMVSFAEQIKYHLIGTYVAQNIAINIRDERMAKNLIWYKERHKNEKIIVWTANFHGAKKIREIKYKDEDPELYYDFILFGEHLHNAYGNNMYSIAFTSALGETLNPLGEKPMTKKIYAKKGSLEYALYNKGIEYGFLDFSAIRKSSPELKANVFNTHILGHDNKPGKWLNVFDGVFFLKTEKPLDY